MNSTRSFLWLALLACSFFIWQAWEQDYNSVANTTVMQETNGIVKQGGIAADKSASMDVPLAETNMANHAISEPQASNDPVKSVLAPHITVHTDVLDFVIDTQGGNIIQADLLAYPVSSQKPDEPVRLLSNNEADFFVTQSGLVSNDITLPDHHALYQAQQLTYTLPENQQLLEIPLTWESESGVRVKKIYRLQKGSYAITLNYVIENETNAPVNLQSYRQMQRTSPLVNRSFSFTNPEQYSFVGASWFSEQEHYEKLAFDDFLETPLSREITGGWSAFQQHYFVAAWIPETSEKNQYTTAVLKQTKYLIRQMGASYQIAPQAQKTLSAQLYIGPKLQNTLPKVAKGLEYSVDYGMVTFISDPLFHYVLNPFHRWFGNWGIAIILTTLVVKLLLYPLSESQYRSMAKMRKFAPRMQALKERFGDDKQKLNQAMMELYQKEKINPLGGCFPMLIQMPVFIALYWVLLESVELRQAPFLGWIHNLSDKDPYFILPIINGAVMLVQQKLSPATGMDPMQQKVMQFMPIIFSFMFAFFPAGLVLYWTVSGMLGLLQQWIITKRVEKAQKA